MRPTPSSAGRYSFQGRLDEATQECLRAIEVDPDFGNPYNDIGCYLMQQGKLEEAVPWLERAKQAKRYEPRQFPYMNLAPVQLKQGKWSDAPRESKRTVAVWRPATPTRRALSLPGWSVELRVAVSRLTPVCREAEHLGVAGR